MLYREYLDKTSFSKEDLLGVCHGNLVEDPPAIGMAKLPAPPFLMFDRVTKVEREGRTGRIVAEQDIHPDAWYFQCHFRGDPVQPGCLGIDAVWQLLGFYISLAGAPGCGRALGAGKIEFLGQIRPFDKVVTYDVNVRRFSQLKKSGTALAIADATVAVDGTVIYEVEQAKVGVFEGIAYADYPNPNSPFARGGLLVRE